MSTDVRRDAAVCALLCVVSIPIVFFGLGAYSPVHMDELLYHGIAREMLSSGDFAQLRFGDEHRFYDALMNAPIHYWAKGLVIQLFGEGRIGMRALSAAFGLATACLLALCVTRIATRRAGLLAGLLLLTTYQFVFLHGARTGEMETLIAFVFVAQAALFLAAVAGRRSFLAHHLCLVVLAHLKLPLVLLPVGAELLWFALVPSARPALWPWLRTLLWVSPLFALWRVVQVVRFPNEALDVVALMWAQAAGDAPKVAREHVGPLGNALFYLRTFVFGAFPAILVAPLALVAGARSAGDGVDATARRFFALQIVVIVVFFVFVSKHFPWYVTPAHPFLCALVALWLDDRWRTAPGAVATGVLASLLALGAWLRFPAFAYDPFASSARSIPEFGWAPFALLGVPATAAALWWALRRVPPRALAAGLAAVLVGVGAARGLAALRFLDYESGAERFRAEVDRARATGEPLPNPLLYTREANESGLTRLWYFFGDEYWIVPQREQGRRTRVVALYDRRLPPPPGVGEAN